MPFRLRIYLKGKRIENIARPKVLFIQETPKELTYLSIYGGTT
jgi:hypothetical protein